MNDIDKLRAEYFNLCQGTIGLEFCTLREPADFNIAAKRVLEQNGWDETPTNYVRAARLVAKRAFDSHEQGKELEELLLWRDEKNV